MNVKELAEAAGEAVLSTRIPENIREAINAAHDLDLQPEATYFDALIDSMVKTMLNDRGVEEST